MRVGVSGKAFLGYAVLLLAFGTNAVFLAAYLHGARQQVTGHNLLLDLAAKVETAHRRVLEFDQDGRNKPKLAATYFEYAAADLEGARHAVDRFLADEPGHPRRQEFEGHARRLAALEVNTRQAQQALIPYFEERPKELDDRFPQLRNDLDIFKDQLQRELRGVASQMREQWKNAVQMGIILGGAGLLAAIGAALWLWRTLRPLQELRLKARRIASGDYGKRIGIYSRDEIGDLAREFDGMAWALQEREQRLIRSERLATVGKVAAQITHEIRNPLASIGLNAELLVDELAPAQNEGRRLLEVISGEIDRLSEITESYLRYVRLPRPKLMPEDPSALVSAVMEFARSELALAGITLELDAPPGLPEIAADENQLRQALLNLVRNAREAMPDGGRLQVAVAATAEDRVNLKVTDSGAGIAPQHLGRIFEPFFSTKEKGTGLGLALVQHIVTEHGARIEVRSAGQRGTVFELSFPMLRRPAASVSGPAPETEEDEPAPPARPARALAVPNR
jgi:two-component system NtrC family sensor kinase